MLEKRCPRCKEAKLLTEFGKDRRNKDGLNIYCRACKKLYNDEQKSYRDQYYKENPRKSSYKTYESRVRDKEYHRIYRRLKPEVTQKSIKVYQSRLLAAGENASKNELDECLSFFNHECAYSGVPLSNKYHMDHIVPLSKDGSNNIHNRVPCLPTINLIKSTKDFETWYPSQSFYSEKRYLKIKEWMKKGEV